MRNLYVLTIAKVGFALLGFSAIVSEAVVLIERNSFNSWNFFSYFTIEMNALATVSLLVGAIAMNQKKRSEKVDFFRGAVAFYMVTVGVVFSILLSGLDAELTAIPWDNTVLHYIMPIAIALDWLIDHPSKRIEYKRALLWLSVPLLYLIYSLVRGSIVHWYPYPFLNYEKNGALLVVLCSVGIFVFSMVMSFIVSKVPDWVRSDTSR